MSATGGSLGVNLAGIGQWSSQSPFIDHFKSARVWLNQTQDTWDTGEPLPQDENGWVTYLEDGQAAGTVVLPGGEAQQTGRYVVLYEGEGELGYGIGGEKIAEESVAGRDVFRTVLGENEIAADQQAVWLQVKSTNPDNPIKNIRVYHEDDLPLVELGLRFRPEFLENVKKFGSFRYMDWMDTNYSTQEEWSGRPTPNDYSFMRNGAPIEVIVELANLTGTNPWINIPHLATDEYVQNIATYVRDNLDPNLNAYVEFSNEVWNSQFEQHWWAEAQGIANLSDEFGNPPEAPAMQWYGVRAAQVADIFRNTFAQDTGAPTLTTVFASISAFHGYQSYGLEAPAWVAKGGRSPAESFDALAIAPYFGAELGDPTHSDPNLNGGVNGIVRQWAQQWKDGNQPDAFGKTGMDYAFEQMRYGRLIDTNSWDDLTADQDLGLSLAQIKKDLAFHRSSADQYGLQLLGYEAGQHISGILGNQADDLLTEFFVALNRDPRMGELYDEYLQLWKDAGGDLLSLFNDVGEASKWGSWGHLERWNQESSPKYDALLEFLDQNDRWWADGFSTNKVGELLRGTSGADTLLGSTVNDTLLGGDDRDSLTGGTGNDYLHGGSARDVINGGAGNDVLMGGLGSDVLNGGMGNDLFRFSDWRQGTDSINDFNRRAGDADRILLVDDGFSGLGLGQISASQYAEGASLAAAAANLAGGSGAGILMVQAGTSVELYYDADVSVAGGEKRVAVLLNQNLANLSTEHIVVVDGDKPTSEADTAFDPVFVPSASATPLRLNGSITNDLLRGGSRGDSINGGAGSDILHGETGADTLVGSSGDDRLFGGAGDDVLNGGVDNDALLGGEGNDTLLGGNGMDRLVGEAGDDLLRGGQGADILTGGTGNDRFLLTAQADLGDTITDLGSGGDFDQIILQGSTFNRLQTGSPLYSQFGSAVSQGEDVALTLGYATESAIAKNGGVTGTAFLLIQNFGLTSTSVYYDPNTAVAGNEMLVVKLLGHTPESISPEWFNVVR